MVSRLKRIDKLGYVVPEGAFYVFCNIAKTGMDSDAFANRILEEAFVSLIPGSAFGRNDYVRISFATSLEQLAKGIDRLEQWVKQ